MTYKFDAKAEIENIVNHMKQYFEDNNLPRKAIIGISGGKDSTVVAALAVRAFGKENVLGIMMPNGEQKDIDDSKRVIDILGIESHLINIGPTYDALLAAVEASTKKPATYQFKTNTPARLRMSTLYGISHQTGGVVLNTCNFSEDVMGFSTFYGDSAGSYAPIRFYTVSEVRAIGDELGLPHDLVHKTPSDGMCGTSDENKLSEDLKIEGFTYERLDEYVRVGGGNFTLEEQSRIIERFKKMKYKLDILNIPGPKQICERINVKFVEVTK